MSFLAPSHAARPAWVAPVLAAAAATGLAGLAAALGWSRHRAARHALRAPLIETAERKAETAGVAPGPATPDGDDLKIIEGLGPRAEAALVDAGIERFDQLAELRPGRLERILREAGGRMSDPTTWPEQARLAAAGRWRELGELQVSLSRGRRRPGWTG